MQHLAGSPSRGGPFQGLSSGVRARVRFLAYHRIKPHVPPLVRAPVNSFEFHRCRRTPQAGHLTLSLRHPREAPPDGKCPSFTARTTRVSNPVRYPRLRASASVCGSHAASAIGVLRHIYAFHRYMTRSACAAATPAPQYRRLGGVEPRIFTAGLPGRLRTL